MQTPDTALSVRQLNLYVKSLLEGDPRLNFISVTGELSNFKRHYASGHCYFTLKDDSAAIRGVMFKNSAARVTFEPADGMLVTVRGRVSLYEKDGQYQFYAEEMYDAGAGNSALQFEKLKQRLAAEGLFDVESKRPIPKFPKKVAVVTSETGAAVRDILNILSRRWPLCEVVLCPVSVQGNSAPSEMTATLDRVYTLDGIDTVIIGRGGGSAEDLSAFNDEKLARKIYESPIPVISAVGHETDFTICDFVADLRAPTPSAAAELAVPDMYDIAAKVSELRTRILKGFQGKYELCFARYNALSGSSILKKPLQSLELREQRIDELLNRMDKAVQQGIKNSESALAKSAAALDALSPLKTLARGYATVSVNGKTVNCAEQLKTGDRITVTFCDGSADCSVEQVRGNNNG